MNYSSGIIGIGCALGAAASTIASLPGISENRKRMREMSCEDFLQTKDKSIVDQNGNTVCLRGVSLNGWLLPASSLAPIDCSDKDWSYSETLRMLTDRFGEYGACQLVKNYSDNWITENDLDYLKKLGVNCLRIPFCCTTVFSDNSCKGEGDFSKLDDFTEQCAKRGIYVILDLWQTPSKQSGESGRDILFEDSSDGKRARKYTARLWRAVAAHFCGNPAVAAYALMSKTAFGFAEDKKSAQAFIDLCNKFYKTIRRVDKKHIIEFDSMCNLTRAPSPEKLRWKNVVYHIDAEKLSSLEFSARVRDFICDNACNLPFTVDVSLGSTLLDSAVSLCNRSEISWIASSYKSANRDGLDDPFLFSGSPDAADLRNDSYDEIMKKWGKPLQTKISFKENKALAKTLYDYCKGGICEDEKTVVIPEKKEKPVFRFAFGKKMKTGA